ncbi:hypothetical protein CANMA_003270 [Candida margitis]|uniref:uncharacterized protein n=1 Tax=Candida margitis TaxID=1775924 RepID=UPI0022276B13|nr:uncharacterized protein CANMA_003270 [Candida margitis]KAI5966593.1 hypothetical protein CANMA_003270 [Candida margitis]
MNFKSTLHTDRYVDGFGNCFTLEPDRMNLESEIAPLGACFSYSDYNEAFHPNESEVINSQSEMECDDVDVDLEVISEQEETCKCKRGPYRYYSEAHKQRFWQLVISIIRKYGWSKVGEKSVLKVPITRDLNVSFLGAISSKGSVDLKVRVPAQVAPNKKRKLGSNTTISEEKTRVGTTSKHFYAFVKSVL